MKYIYGTDASYSTTKPTEATVDEIINIIKDVNGTLTLEAE